MRDAINAIYPLIHKTYINNDDPYARVYNKKGFKLS